MLANTKSDNTIRMFICDDNVLVAEIIKDFVEMALPKNRSIELLQFDHPKSLWEEWNKGFADAVMLDIHMPQIDGFALAQKLLKSKPDLEIIFVSGYKESVFQSYDYHPFWFIRKDHLEEIEKVVPKLVAAIDARRRVTQRTVLLKAENQSVELNLDTLTYIESCKNDIVIHDKQRGDWRIRCKLSEAEQQLLPAYILRIQKSILVNCRCISKVTSREVVFTDGTAFNVGRDRIDFVRTEYRKYLQNGT